MIDLWNRLLEDGYRTGAAFLVGAVALTLMINLGTVTIARPIITLGAFAFTWFFYNTATGSTTPLYGDDARLWDVATQDALGFLIIAVVVGCAIVFVWRFSIRLPSRLLLVFGMLFGTSLLWGVIAAGTELWQTNVGS